MGNDRRYKHHLAKIYTIILSSIWRSDTCYAGYETVPSSFRSQTAFGISYSSQFLLHYCINLLFVEFVRLHNFITLRFGRCILQSACNVFLLKPMSLVSVFVHNSLTFRWCWTSTCLTNSHSLRLEYPIYNSSYFGGYILHNRKVLSFIGLTLLCPK